MDAYDFSELMMEFDGFCASEFHRSWRNWKSYWAVHMMCSARSSIANADATCLLLRVRGGFLAKQNSRSFHSKSVTTSKQEHLPHGHLACVNEDLARIKRCLTCPIFPILLSSTRVIILVWYVFCYLQGKRVGNNQKMFDSFAWLNWSFYFLHLYFITWFICGLIKFSHSNASILLLMCNRVARKQKN
jgi:hypothetical protein